MDPVWYEADSDTGVAFETGCTGTVRLGDGRDRQLKCAGAGYVHGHARVVVTEDGECWLPFPVASQAGLREMLRVCVADGLADVEKNALLAVPEVLHLPRDLTPGEAALLADPIKLEPFTHYAWVSGGR